ncbi:MAG TPA: hypothetical protein VFW94_19035 [Candidatus Acidoferrales bacterium]|nr:hypothetical protein [Candidatus Acidoferrales bacterium]
MVDPLVSPRAVLDRLFGVEALDRFFDLIAEHFQLASEFNLGIVPHSGSQHGNGKLCPLKHLICGVRTDL